MYSTCNALHYTAVTVRLKTHFFETDSLKIVCKIMANSINILLLFILIHNCMVCAQTSHFVKFTEVQSLKSGDELKLNGTDSNATKVSTMSNLQCLQMCLVYSDCDAVKYVVPRKQCKLFKNAVAGSSSPDGRSGEENVYLKAVRTSLSY